MAFTHLKQRGLSSVQSHPLALSINRVMATSTTPKFAASGAINNGNARPVGIIRSTFASYGPTGVVIGIIGGFVGMACMIGIHTAKQQLLHSPSVQITQKKRESVPEVDSPDVVLRSADKFLNKSFLRKVGHIQDKHANSVDEQTRYGSTARRDSAAEAETLKSVGVIK